MPNRSLTPLLRYLRKITAAPASGETGDPQLLARFIVHRDQAAFAELVNRHGPMVMGVCRRVLGDWHEAEDAFQAAFLVLARKAGSVRKPELLANWLYGVAFRTALKARGLLAQRRAKAKPLMEISIPQTDAGIAELGPLLDEELQRLPAKYRAPMVLCYFEGKTHEEIARQLGCPRETVSTRMARGRERLRKRPVRRGVTITSTALAAMLSEQAVSASVAPALADATVKAAVLFAVAEAAVAGTVSTPVIALTQGVIKAMMISRMMNAAIAVLALAIVGTGTGLVWHGLAAANGPDEPKAAATAPEEANAPDADNQKQQDKKPKVEGRIATLNRAKELRQKLNQPVTMELDQTSLKEALALIAERYGITILLDSASFATTRDDEDPNQVENAPVKLPRLTEVSLRIVLREILNQVQGDFYVKEGIVRVAHRNLVDGDVLLRQPIDATFTKEPLADALKELSLLSGVSVVLDPKVEENAQQPITADLPNVPVETALLVLTDMADLRPVMLHNVVYVTSKENARVIQRENYRQRAGIVPEPDEEDKPTPKIKKRHTVKPAP